MTMTIAGEKPEEVRAGHLDEGTFELFIKEQNGEEELWLLDKTQAGELADDLLEALGDYDYANEGEVT